VQENAEKILLVLYTETNSKKPQMASVNQTLKLSAEDFGRAVNILYVIKFISGVTVRFGEEDNNPVMVSVDNILLTRRGATYVEGLLNVKTVASQIQKLQRVIEKAKERGWDDVKELAAKALEEYMQG
jgi:hypothetical protein